MSGHDDREQARMSEEATPQRTRLALDPFLGIRVRRLHSHIQAHWGEWFAVIAPGLTPAQGGALMLVAENPGITLGELAALLRIEAPSLSQIVAPLVRRRLVTRSPGHGDRRVAVLTVSADGQAIADAIAADGPAHEAAALARLTPAEQAELKRLLDRALESDETAEQDAPSARKSA